MTKNSRISFSSPAFFAPFDQALAATLVDLYIANNPQSKSVIMMSSGGSMKDEKTGKVTSFFVRQSPTEASSDMPDGSMNSSLPWAATRSTPPLSYFKDKEIFNSIYANGGEYRASPGYLRANEKVTPKISTPGVVSRSIGLVKGRLQGVVPSGWAYQNKKQRDGTYSVAPTRLFVSVHQKNISGTSVHLPTREITLFEFSRETPRAGADIPEVVKKIQVFLPESKNIISIDDAGGVVKKATVNCHEIGQKYLLYRPVNAVGKRRLLVFAHGMNCPREITLKEGIKISFFAPNGSSLLSVGSPARVPLEAIYSTHQKEKSRTFSSFDSVEVKVKGENKLGDKDGSDLFGVQDILLAKVGSPIHDSANAKRGKLSAVMHNTNEGAAWAAVDKNIDVILLRQQTGHPRTGCGSLKGLMSELEEKGLGDEYDEILVHACRAEGRHSALYGIARNLSPSPVS